MGGKETLFQLYHPDDFTDSLLRRVWRWLWIRSVEDDCTIWNYNFDDPVAPKFSVLADCINESPPFGVYNYIPQSFSIEGKEYDYYLMKTKIITFEMILHDDELYV